MEKNDKKVELLINKGFEFHQQGNFDDAEPLYEEALKLDSDNAEVYNLIGVLKLQKGDVELAEEYVEKAISIYQCEYFYETLFQILIRQADYQSIIKHEQTILHLYPKSFPLLFDIAFAYKNMQQNNKAIQYYEKALHINPMSYEGWLNIANIYNMEGRINDAISAMEICLKLRPDDEEIQYFLAINYLKAKNYKKGLPLFEKRSSKKIAYNSQRKTLADKIREDNLWHGENIKNKNIYIYLEAGYGDAIMYARYLPFLAKKCNRLTLMCHKGLTKLFETNKKHLGIDKIVDTYMPDSMLDIDVHASILSLPYLLGLKGDDIFVSSEGYIIPETRKVEEARKKYFNNDKIKVGIKWRGNTAFDTDRAIPAELFNQLIDMNNAQYYSFQTFEGSEDIDKLHNIIDISKNLTDFNETAAYLKNLDLVICNDTSLAHLAGAMRIPCWVLLPYNTDWRWHNNVTQCDWYESVKLFRQDNIGDWQSAFNKIVLEMSID